MDFNYDLGRFVRDNPGKRIAVIFHTSVVLESVDNLKSFFSSKSANVDVYATKNSISELELLSKHSTYPRYREKAKLILENIITGGAWSATDMCTFSNEFLDSYHCDVAVFVFYEPAAAQELSEKMGKLANTYILSYDPYESKTPLNLAKPVGSDITRKCIPLTLTPRKQSFKPDDVLTVMDRKKNVVGSLKVSELDFFRNGGESMLFLSKTMPDKIIKLYKFVPDKHMTDKLKLMYTFRELFGSCTMPVEFIYLNGSCVGYVMEKLEGTDLGCILTDITEAKKLKLIRDLSVTILELRLAQFIITDFSMGNIFVLKNGGIRIVDCDSMEFHFYPGGGITPPYGHPDVTEDYYYKKHRKAEQVNFSYAVMLFEILLGWRNPLGRKGLGTREPEWRKDPFPYTNENGCAAVVEGMSVNEEKLKMWRKQSSDVRDGFVDVFNFRASYDIGEWISRIGLK